MYTCFFLEDVLLVVTSRIHIAYHTFSLSIPLFHKLILKIQACIASNDTV